MKSPIRILASLVLLGFLAGCGDSGTSPAAGNSPVSMPTPSGWTRQDDYTTSGGTKVDFKLTSDKGSASVISRPLGSLTGAEMASALIAVMQTQYPSMVVDTNVARTVAGHPAQLLDVHFSVQGTVVDLRQLFVRTGSNDIQIIFSWEYSDAATAAVVREMESQIRIQ